MSVMVMIQIWTGVSTQKKIYSHSFVRKIAMAALKKGKSAGVDNILEELVQAGGKSVHA